MPRKTVETYPPFSLEDFLSGTDSGCISPFRAQSRLGRRGETCHYFRKFRTIQGDRSEGIPDSRSGLIFGDFPLIMFVWRQLSRLLVCCQVLLLALQRASRRVSPRASFPVSLKALLRLALALTPWPGQRVLRAQPSSLELEPWVLLERPSPPQRPSFWKPSVPEGDSYSSHKQEQSSRQVLNRYRLPPGRQLRTHLS